MSDSPVEIGARTPARDPVDAAAPDLAVAATDGTAALQLEWPPSSADIDAIEIISLDPQVAEVSSRPSSRSAPALAHAAPKPAQPPAPADLVEVVELDAVDGPEVYVLDLRTAEEPRSDGTSPVAASAGAPVDVPARTPAAPAGPETVVAATPAVSAPVETGPGLSWPPRDADVEGITVVDLALVQPAPAPPRPHDRGPGAEDRQPVVRPVEPAPETDADLASLPAQPERAPRPPVFSWQGEPAPAVSKGRPGPVRIALLAASLLIVAAGSYLAWQWQRRPAVAPTLGVESGPAGSVPGQPESPVPAVAGSSAPPSLAPALLDQASVARARGERVEAMRFAVQALRAEPDSPGAMGVVEELLGEARAAAVTVRRAALERVPDARGLTDFRTAGGREAAASNAWRDGQYEDALRMFTDARTLYARLQPPSVAASAEPSGPAPLASAPPSASAPIEAIAPRAEPLSAAPGSPGPAAVPVPSPVPLPPPAPAPGVSLPSPAPVARETTSSGTGPAAVVDEAAEVRRVLTAYQGAYSRLDAGAAAAVYPSLDARALARAFADLRAQRFDFERCDVTVPPGAVSAQAACVGRAAFVPKVGSQAPTVEQRRWAFALQKQAGTWRITRATVTR